MHLFIPHERLCRVPSYFVRPCEQQLCRGKNGEVAACIDGLVEAPACAIGVAAQHCGEPIGDGNKRVRRWVGQLPGQLLGHLLCLSRPSRRFLHITLEAGQHAGVVDRFDPFICRLRWRTGQRLVEPAASLTNQSMGHPKWAQLGGHPGCGLGGVGQAELHRLAQIWHLLVEALDPLDLPGTEPLVGGVTR